MEAGRSIYYKGNTLAGPHPNAKNRRKRQLIAAGEQNAPDKVMPHEPKTCATSQCVWCGNAFPDGMHLVVCMFCHTCQYCGLVSYSSDACPYCGNMLDDNLKQNRAVSDTVYSNRKRVRA